MKKNYPWLIISASLITGSVTAGTMGPVLQPSPWRWIGTLSVGPVWNDDVSAQTFYLTPEIIKTYTANKTNSTLVNGEVFLGIQHAWSPSFYSQWGLAVAATNNVKLSGHIWDDADPQFNNFTYRYKIQHTYVGFKGKFLADMGYWLIPWISGSLGAGFNYAHDFNNTPLIFEALPNSNFTSHTETTFSYTVGAGVQMTLNPNWQIGVGYEFADWGKSHLGRATGQTNHWGLEQNHLYTNGVLFNLTYLA
ncbi:outer membrane protein [Legionella gresilensis]|uniref:outer membrane protein n=1 Tax=Legionella gresilensis TaxID=91823 RepID=UPI001041AB5E|nr:porin family protein [Legionella gresilensis]